MRLLAPAVLLGFGALVLTGPASALRTPSEASLAEPSPTLLADASVGPQLAASPPEAAPQTTQSATPSAPSPTITLPAGTRVTLALTNPIWAKKVKAGEAVYAVTAFPVISPNGLAIPAGTYVLGQIDAVTKPNWRDSHAQFQMHFSKIIFANGYTVLLQSAPAQTATATIHVRVSSRNDILLDNGDQFDMVVQTPLPLEADRVTQAVRLTHPLPPGSTKSASLCRPIPATPGTSDTVIPGTPGTTGTPDIVIPGPNGTTTVIPGTPATPGTPPTIIPGTSGTPEIPCPGPPAVIPGPSGPQIHRQSFQVANELVVSGAKLPPGSYDVAWLGTDASVQVELQKSGKTIARLPARIAVLPQSATSDKTVTRANADGTTSIASLEFAGEAFAVVFD